MVVFPVFQAWWIGFGVIGGIVFYQQYEDLTTEQWGVYLFGGSLMICGCWLLIFGEYQNQKRKQKERADRAALAKGNDASFVTTEVKRLSIMSRKGAQKTVV